MTAEGCLAAIISIVVPTLNEETTIGSTLQKLQALRRRGVEVIVCDGGSTDRTTALVQGLCDTLRSAPRGRASQMNTGAAAAHGDILLFLHADTQLPENACDAIINALRAPEQKWGRFDIRFDSAKPAFRFIERMMNVRSRWSGIATGDQAIFVRRSTFEALQGFPNQALMEDIALSRTLKRLGPPACLRDKVTTSARRWERNGIASTVVLMWALRLAYWLGANPSKLAALYGKRSRDNK